jgi:hypothetical protein
VNGIQTEVLSGWSSFISNVGAPMAILFIVLIVFVLPFVLFVVQMLRKYVPLMVESHVGFMETSSRTQETNAATLAKLETTITAKHQDHVATHEAILLGAKAGIAILDGEHNEARDHLNRIDQVLAKR